MGEYQDKIFAVGIKHRECQLSIVIFAEIRIATHIVGEIIHPAHIPLIIKSKSAVFWIAGDHRPSRRFFRDQDRAILSALKYCI